MSENASKHTVGRGLFSNLMYTKIGTSESLQCSPLLNEKQLLLEVGDNGGTWLVNEQVAFVDGQNFQQGIAF